MEKVLEGTERSAKIKQKESDFFAEVLEREDKRRRKLMEDEEDVKNLRGADLRPHASNMFGTSSSSSGDLRNKRTCDDDYRQNTKARMIDSEVKDDASVGESKGHLQLMDDIDNKRLREDECDDQS